MKQMKNVKKLKGPMQKVTKGLKKVDDIQDRVTTVADGVTDGITAMTDFTEAVSGAFPAGAGGEFNASGGGYVQETGGYVQEPGGYMQEPFHQARAHVQEPTAAADSDPSNDVYGVNMTFEEAFVEHKGVETVNCWKSLLTCLYEFWLKCTYNVMMFLCGICVVISWGVTYSCITWIKTWCINPMSIVVIVFIKGYMPMILEPISMCRRKLNSITTIAIIISVFIVLPFVLVSLTFFIVIVLLFRF